jgi:hypothetical protein
MQVPRILQNTPTPLECATINAAPKVKVPEIGLNNKNIRKNISMNFSLL